MSVSGVDGCGGGWMWDDTSQLESTVSIHIRRKACTGGFGMVRRGFLGWAVACILAVLVTGAMGSRGLEGKAGDRIGSTRGIQRPRLRLPSSVAVASGRTLVPAPPSMQFSKRNPYQPPYRRVGNVRDALPGTFTVVELIEAVNGALDDAVAGVHALPERIFDLVGMSGRTTRMFFNNLFRRLVGAHYLEVGSWRGSTLISALFNNTAHTEAVAVDNWSQFLGSFDLIRENVQRELPEVVLDSPQVRFFQQNVYAMDFRAAGLEGWADVYFYDGDHDPFEQERAIEYMLDQNVLRRPCLVLVDDWINAFVHRSTIRSMEGVWRRGWKAEFAMQVDQYGRRVRSSAEIQDSIDPHNKDKFWNGALVLVLN